MLSCLLLYHIWCCPWKDAASAWLPCVNFTLFLILCTFKQSFPSTEGWDLYSLDNSWNRSIQPVLSLLKSFISMLITVDQLSINREIKVLIIVWAHPGLWTLNLKPWHWQGQIQLKPEHGRVCGWRRRCTGTDASCRRRWGGISYQPLAMMKSTSSATDSGVSGGWYDSASYLVLVNGFHVISMAPSRVRSVQFSVSYVLDIPWMKSTRQTRD